MKLLLFHVSDIHLSTQRFPDNHILGRAPEILSAVHSMFLTKEQIASVVMLVAGDIAYAGRKDEYDLALPFFKAIQDGLSKEFPAAERHAFFLPGNHDCDFDRDGQARQRLIVDPAADSLGDGSIIDIATSIQEEFFTFCQQFSGGTGSPKGLARLYAEHDLTVAGRRVVFRLMNSAWLSRMRESRALMLPVPYLAPRFKTAPAPDLVVTAFHHPYNWFDPTNATALRKLLEEQSDVIVTGHEHSADTYTKTGLSGEQNDYIEGGVLQENGDPSTSAFNVILIDFDSADQTLHHFEWTGGIYETVSPVVSRPFVRNRNRLKNEYLLKPKFDELLNHADTAYSHPKKEHVTLEDVFLYPDCIESEDKQTRPESPAAAGKVVTRSTTRVVPGKELISHILKKQRVCITAAERAGKTALARTLFKDLRKMGKIPLLLNGRDFKSASVRRLAAYLDGAFNEQYDGDLLARYWQLPKESRAVLVDDYHRLPETKDARDTFVAELLKRFEVVVFLGGGELRLAELVGREHESNYLWDFHHVEVMAFGHRLRAEFVRKWYRIGREGDDGDGAGGDRMVALEKTITGILGKDLLPPYPVYLLLLLQQIESANAHEISAASYGRLYGAVLTAYLAKTGAVSDLETKVAYLAELAYHLYDRKVDRLPDDAALAWHGEYCRRQLVQLDHARFLADLGRSQVLLVRDGEVSFRYKAGFYYFVAQHMSENLARPAVRDEVRRLCGQLHHEESANIVVFLCHLSKEPLIVNEVLANAGRLFAGEEETDILKDAAFTEGMLPTDKPVLQLTDPERNRLEALAHRDAAADDAELEDSSYLYRAASPPAEEEVDLATVNINQAVKTIQVAGQILRNYGGRLDGSRKLELAEACYALAMRMLKWIYKGFQENEEGLIAAARESICERHKRIDPTVAVQNANALVFGLLKLATFGLVKQVSHAIGLEKLSPVFDTLVERDDSVGRRLIDLSIRLDHYAAVPEAKIAKLHEDVSDSLIVTDVLRQLVFYRFYYFVAQHNVKQRICEQVGIKLVPALLDRDPKRNA
ncbi:MAG: hypothetical protein C0501_27050 [Isosphaera sp.]|nr:hypothetical protein [Isosphaera sp.]